MSERTPRPAAFPSAEQVIDRFDRAVSRTAPAADNGWARVDIALSDVEARPLDFVTWLRRADSDVRLYWLGRDGSFEAAGIDVATAIRLDHFDYASLFANLQGQLSDMPAGLRYYGAGRFDPVYPPGRISPAWQQFGGCRFVIPLVELMRDRDRLQLHCNIPSEDCKRSLDRCREIIHRAFAAECENDENLPAIVGRSETPNRDRWVQMVNTALEHIVGGQLRKVVLARRQSITFQSPPDAASLLSLQQRPDARGYRFLFEFAGHHAWFGTTPERLYARNGREIETEAVAGTRPRGKTDHDDRRLAEELRASGKEREEHSYVANYVRSRLDELCSEDATGGEPEVLKLPALQHLYRRFAGRLRDDVDDGAIVTALHPTPAVGGEPIEIAAKEIRDLEPFDRGWYAGPVGWIARDASDFAVAIRSARLHKEELTLYAGAGIVDGSDARAEWDETAHKLQSIFAGRLP